MLSKPRNFSFLLILIAGIYVSVPFSWSAESGWRWIHEKRNFIQLWDIWGTSAKDVFAVGVSGTILHFDGSQWKSQKSGTEKHLLGMWGSSGSDVFAVGLEGTIVHYNGKAWKSMKSGTKETLLGVWGTSSEDVFAVGNGGTILHYDGKQWASQASDTSSGLAAVWGTSQTNVYAVGTSGTITRYDGKSWHRYAEVYGEGVQFNAVAGTSEQDIYVVGFKTDKRYEIKEVGKIESTVGVVLHWNGETWELISDNLGLIIEGIAPVSITEVYFAGGVNFPQGGNITQYNGKKWSSTGLNSAYVLHSIWKAPSGELFAVGDKGAICCRTAP